jgi:hypothetical protein
MPPRRRATEDKTLDELTKAELADLFELLGEPRPHNSTLVRIMRETLRPLVGQRIEEGFHDPRFSKIFPPPVGQDTPRSTPHSTPAPVHREQGKNSCLHVHVACRMSHVAQPCVGYPVYLQLSHIQSLTTLPSYRVSRNTTSQYPSSDCSCW